MAGTAGAPSDGVAVEAKRGHWQWAHSRYWFVDGVSMWAARARHWETRDQARFGIGRA
ncbi:hypothetical protein [Amycolatopsis sp. WAC 04182]|uniref:hypothetical protein n=1 Tax=Amycolatopsis sp. WAC 04182 TaxID=2203198 RepID=UPI0013151833|nr:hypothetical protein [Amycolatopsis sp. WAC 04182]